MHIPELGEIALSSEDEQRFLDYLEQLRPHAKDEKINLYDVIALLVGDRRHCSEKQATGLKFLAKKLYTGKLGNPDVLKNKDDYYVTPTKKDLKKFQQEIHSKTIDIKAGYQVIEVKNGRQVVYDNPETANRKGEKVVVLKPSDKIKKSKPKQDNQVVADERQELKTPVSRINWNNKEQATEWLNQVLEGKVHVTKYGWIVSLEFAALFLTCFQISKLGRIRSSDDVIANLSEPKQPEQYKPNEVKQELAQTKQSSLEQIEMLQKQVADLQHELEQAKQETKEVVKEKEIKQTSWKRLLGYFLMTLIDKDTQIEKQDRKIKRQENKIVKQSSQLAEIDAEKQLIKTWFPALPQFFEQISRLTHKVQEKGKFSENLLTIKEMMDRIATDELITIGSAKNLKKIQYPGVEDYIWCKDDARKMQLNIAAIFRALLGSRPVKKANSFAYPEDFLELAAWFGKFCSPYTKDFAFKNDENAHKYLLPNTKAQIDNLLKENIASESR